MPVHMPHAQQQPGGGMIPADRSAALPWNQPGVRDTLLHRPPPGMEQHPPPSYPNQPPPNPQNPMVAGAPPPSAVLPLSNALEAAASMKKDGPPKSAEEQIRQVMAEKQQLLELGQSLISK